MKLNRLSLANYRGFEQIDIDFAPDVTVIAGVNGVGKSGVLKALATAFSHGFPFFTPSLEGPQSLIDTDVQYGKTGLSVSVVLGKKDAEVRIDINRLAPLDPSKAKDLLKRRDDLRFATRETRKDSKDALEIEDEIHRIELLLADVSDMPIVRVLPKDGNTPPTEYTEKAKSDPNQPIAVFYTTARYLSRLPPILQNPKGPEVATAYAGALKQLEVSLNDFANWYRALTGDGIYKPALATTFLQQLESALSIFLPDLSGLALHADRPPRFSLQKNGARFFLEQLSDGEKGLLALVFDLTRRLTIANPESSNPIAESTAIVLIDEIELHLHPKWQRQVVRRLNDVFKRCQFIITTHSPQVIGQVKAKKLRLLHFDESGRVANASVSQSFGMDSSWVLQHIMGGTARDYKTEQKLASIYDAVEVSEFGVAREKAELLRVEVGDFPDLQEVFALLDRFELLGRK